MSTPTLPVVKWKIETNVTDNEDTSAIIVQFYDPYRPIEFSFGDMSAFTDLLRDHIASAKTTNAPGIRLDNGDTFISIKRTDVSLNIVADHGNPDWSVEIDLPIADAHVFADELETTLDEAQSELDAKLEQGVDFIAAA